MTLSPLEAELQEILTGAFDSAVDVLNAQFEGRPGYTVEETARINLELIGALRDCVMRLAREINDLSTRQ